MGTRVRSSRAIKMKSRRCPKCNRALNNQRKRCPGCHKVQPSFPKK